MFKIFNLTLLLNGFPIKKAKKILDEIIAIPEENYVAFLEEKKKEIVEFHLKNNPFYRNFVGKSTIGNWNDLPIMTKKDLQKPLTERLSVGYSKKNSYINNVFPTATRIFKDVFKRWRCSLFEYGCKIV